jgi:hypothetical protein
MAKSIMDFRNFVLSKYPKMPANQKDALDSFVKQKMAEQISAGGVNVSDIQSDPTLMAVQAQQVESGTYQPKSAEGSKPAAKDVALAKSGLKNLEDVKQLYANDPLVLAKELVPGKFFSRKYNTASYDMADALLRLRTGAQANKTEITGYMKTIAPSFGDSPEDVAYKVM